MLKIKFEVFEIRNDGVYVTHHLHGSRKEIEEELDRLKKRSKCYEMFGKNGMIMWV